MAETDIHRDQMIYLIVALNNRYRDNPSVYVSGNLLIYYREGDPSKSVSPDTFVVFGVPKQQRRVYKLWEEGKAPNVVFEVTSRKTRRQDLRTKWELYAGLGVHKYFLFDPLEEYLEPPLQGYRLVGGSVPTSKSPLHRLHERMVYRYPPCLSKEVDPHTAILSLIYRQA
jgi:Uma2 family endonuclease